MDEDEEDEEEVKQHFTDIDFFNAKSRTGINRVGWFHF